MSGKFFVDGIEVHSFESEPKQPTAGQICASEAGKDVEDTKYDHQYTGRHDHGLLPELKSGGPHGELVQALLVSQASTDVCCAR